MALRRQQAGKNAEKRRRIAQPATIKIKEERMKDREDEAERYRRRVEAFLRQKVRLRGNGVEMELGTVESRLLGLQFLQEEKPKAFETLVAIVKPSGATRLPEKVSAKAVAYLKEGGTLRSDGSPEELAAAVLDAAYVETKEGAILRDPVIPPSRAFVEERRALDEEGHYWAAQGIQNRYNWRGQGGGPSR